jgi:serpin B
MKKIRPARILAALLPAVLPAGATAAEVRADGEAQFAAALYAQLASAENGNLFLSPYSIHAALAMVASGAAGETERQMVETLRLPAGREERAALLRALGDRLEAARAKADVTLDAANRVWSQKSFPLLPAFTAGLEKTFGAGIATADFTADAEGARREINGWVEDRTRQRIRDLLAQGVLTRDTRMVLVNAIYFYGGWQNPFKAEATETAPFHAAGEKDVRVPMMHRLHKETAYREVDGVQVCDLPYKGGELVMTVILPKAGGLPELEQRIAKYGLAPFLEPRPERDVDVYLPRFKLEASFSLAEKLAGLGMRDAFTTAADFSGMTGKKDLFISAVIHKAFVEVNEKGTEAAAATAVIMRATAFRPMAPPVEFRADRPFVFVLRDRSSGLVLFLGRLADPPPGA